LTRLLLKLSAVCPLLGMLLPMIWALFVPGYSSVGQHMSELELLHGPVAAVVRAGALVSGLSIVAFGLALLLRAPRMPFTAVSAVIFGISMISNAVFTMGSPLHGLYAIGLSVILVPAFFAAESAREAPGRVADTWSLLAASLNLIYMWMLMTRLDPQAIHGLTQRLACFPMFGWFSYASLRLLGRSAAPASQRVLRVTG
jgi:hypothetical protein